MILYSSPLTLCSSEARFLTDRLFLGYEGDGRWPG